MSQMVTTLTRTNQIVLRAAIDRDLVIVTKLTNIRWSIFDVIDVEWSGLSNDPAHPNPENHTQREP